LELAVLLLVDHDPHVVEIYTQPFLLTVTIAGSTVTHTPDVLVVKADSSEQIINVKPLERLESSTVRRALGRAQAACDFVGLPHVVATEPNRTVLANIRFIAIFRREVGVNAALLAAVQDAARLPATIGSVEARLSHDAAPMIVRAHVMHALWKGGLECDLSVPLSSRTVLGGEV
jgi:hypothetical protein